MELAPAQMQPDQNQQPVTAWLITAKQAAEVLSVSEGTIWNLVKAGHVAPVKVTPTATRFWLADVIEYAKSRTRKPYGRATATE